MKERELLIQRILNVSDKSFDALACDIFRYQYTNNTLYRQYCDLLKRPPRHVDCIADIPFLPIRFFKSHRVSSGECEPAVVFLSSGTSGSKRSMHAVCDTDLYLEVAASGFLSIFGQPVKHFRWLALLPSYLGRDDASLVFMMRHFVGRGQDGGGFFLDDQMALDKLLKVGERVCVPTILIGVTFALLEFAAKHPQPLHRTQIIETGGMKGRGPELTREEVHAKLTRAFQIDQVGSEYGMTELLSQAWSGSDGIFYGGPTLRVLIRDLRDPFMHLLPGERGGIDCIDLANIDSCSFIQTEDAGMRLGDGGFKVAGRLDGSEARGCNLMLLEREA